MQRHHLSYTEQYRQLSESEKKELMAEFKRKGGDFDASMVPFSAHQELITLGFGDQVKPIAVGFLKISDLSDWKFLSHQLKAKLSADDYNSKYIIFASSVAYHDVPHAIATVINTKMKSIDFIDSCNDLRNREEVYGQLATCVALIPELKGYTVSTIPENYPEQQYDLWSCGVHAADNIVKLVTGKINISGQGVQPRKFEEVQFLSMTYFLAYKNHLKQEVKLEEKFNLNKNQKECVLYLLMNELFLKLENPLKKDHEDLLQAIIHELSSERNHTKNYLDFIKEFSLKNSKNCFLSWMTSPHFLNKLPKTISKAEIVANSFIIDAEFTIEFKKMCLELDRLALQEEKEEALLDKNEWLINNVLFKKNGKKAPQLSKIKNADSSDELNQKQNKSYSDSESSSDDQASQKRLRHRY
jgi:hypothetical protein